MLYQFHPKLVVRSPQLAFLPTELTENGLRLALHEPQFLEALYLASPDLLTMAVSWRDGATIDPRKEQKLLASITKYRSRMMSRCTPFGLFAACSVATWGDVDAIAIAPEKMYRQTRFDMHFCCALALQLLQNSVVRTHLIYTPNTTLYAVGNEVRFIEYQYINGRRSHQISAVTDSVYLQKVLTTAHNGANYEALVNSLIDDQITTEEARPFIDEIIASQLLAHDLEPSITGENFVGQIIAVLQRIYAQTQDESIATIAQTLRELQQNLTEIDAKKINEVAVYQHCIEKIKTLNVGFEENKMFQADLFFTSETNELNTQWQAEIMEALQVMNRIGESSPKEALQSFAKRFSERYESQEIALLQALDTETGIGYTANSTNTLVPLVEDLQLPQSAREETTTWTKTQRLLFEKLRQNKRIISITEEDLKEFPANNQDDWSPSMAVMFRVVENEQQKKNILIESAGGSSAINLLGRFADGNEEIKAIAQQIADTEQALNKDVIFAEIIHLPESRTGNILLHPAFRGYEIPFLGKSSLPTENQLSLSDLWVSVRNGQIVLRSKIHNKIVITRLSNAHNYSANALPVYHFLCDLQHQNKQTSIGFRWGTLANKYKFLPRVVYKNAILEQATWQLTKAEIEKILAGDTLKNVPSFMNDWVVLADGDNELLIDWQNPMSVQSFRDAIKNRENSIVLKEFLYEKTQTTVSNNEQKGHINQCIALLTKTEASYTNIAVRQAKTNVIRDFAIGSSWLYFKLYGGVKVADKVLIENIEPLIQTLESKKLIDQWFFIRYSDPDNHLRLRFRLADTSKIGDVLQLVYQHLQPAQQANYLWKIQTDTYSRELERYGFEGIEQAEAFFYSDSQAVLSFLTHTAGDAREHIRWLWGLRAIDELLNDFDFDINQKHQLMQRLKDGFAKEFNMNIGLKQQLDKKYRQHRAEIQDILVANTENPLTVIFAERTKSIRPIAQTLQNKTLSVTMLDLMASYIHMTVNRLMPTQQRLHELVMYDFLFRQYESEKARLRK